MARRCCSPSLLHTVGEVKTMFFQKSGKTQGTCLLTSEDRLLTDEFSTLTDIGIGSDTLLSIQWMRAWNCKGDTKVTESTKIEQVSYVEETNEATEDSGNIVEKAKERCTANGWGGFMLKTTVLVSEGMGFHRHPKGQGRHVSHDIHYFAEPFEEPSSSVDAPEERFGWDIEGFTVTHALYYLDAWE